MKVIDELKSGIMVSVGLIVGAVLVVPFALVALAMMPFARPDTPDDVAALLRKCIARADDAEDEFDAFTSRKIADPELDEIKTEMVALARTDWSSAETRKRFEELLNRVEAMRTAPAT